MLSVRDEHSHRDRIRPFARIAQPGARIATGGVKPAPKRRGDYSSTPSDIYHKTAGSVVASGIPRGMQPS
jgi:hypothetical protein